MSSARSNTARRTSQTGPAPRPHFITWLFPPAEAGARRQKLAGAIILILALLGLNRLGWPLGALVSPALYDRDLKQEYLLARAVLEGVNPYWPQPALAERFLPLAPVLPHPVPHPPLVAVLSLPLGLVSFQVAAAIWLGVELLLLLAVVVLLAADQNVHWPPVHIFAAFCILLLWTPVQQELFYGQLTLAVAALLFTSWVVFKHGCSRLSGILLGLAIAIKLFPVVIAGYFLVKRQWHVLLWTAGALAASSVVATTVLGVEAISSYLSGGLTGVGYWRAGEGNYSLVGMVWRLFGGSIRLEPLIDLPGAALPLSILAALAVLGIAASAVSRAADPDGEFGLVLCAAILVSPVAWQYYLLLLLWPMWILARRLHASGWPSGPTNQLLVTMLLLSFPAGLALALSRALAESLGGAGIVERGSALASLPLVLLVMGPGLLSWLLLREIEPTLPRRPRNGQPKLGG